MSFGLEKFDWMVVKRRKVVKADGVELPACTIADIQISYTCFDIPQYQNLKEELE